MLKKNKSLNFLFNTQLNINLKLIIMKTLIITLLFLGLTISSYSQVKTEGHEGRNYESARFTCCRN
jgi:hypothetical protein